MARIAGVDLPRNKKLGTALTYIYGLGDHLAGKVLQSAKVDQNKRTEELTEEEVARIRDILESSYKVEGDLRREISMNIKRLWTLGATEAFDTARVCPFAVKEPVRTHGPGRAPKKVPVVVSSLRS